MLFLGPWVSGFFSTFIGLRQSALTRLSLRLLGRLNPFVTFQFRIDLVLLDQFSRSRFLRTIWSRKLPDGG